MKRRTSDRIFDQALETVAIGNVQTALEPVIFTSCSKAMAETYVQQHPKTALIHSTPAGQKLEDLDLFSHMSPKLAYLHWFYLSTRFVIENEFPPEALFIGNIDNPTSTAFGIEIPLLLTTKPNVVAIKNPLSGIMYSRAHWADQNLVREYVLDLVNLYMCGPSASGEEQDSALMRKFGERSNGLPSTENPAEYSTEIGLKLMVSGLLGSAGNFERHARYNEDPLSCALPEGSTSSGP